MKLERGGGWSIDTGRATALERFSRWKNGGEGLFSMNEMDDPFHDVPTSTLITPLERLSNDPETFRHLSAVQFNRRTTRRCPSIHPVFPFDSLMACCYQRLRKLHHRDPDSFAHPSIRWPASREWGTFVDKINGIRGTNWNTRRF